VILYEITGTEANPVYETLEIENGNRQFGFLQSLVTASLAIGKPFLSQAAIRAFNFHSIACLHANAGEYRACKVRVGHYTPPEHYRVPALMDDFVNTVNRFWENTDPIALAAFTLWRMNYIHPFINANGRTARAASYFVLCVKLGGLLPGDKVLPQLLKDNRDEYVEALKAADGGNLALLASMVQRLVAEQIGVPAPTTEVDVTPVHAPPPPVIHVRSERPEASTSADNPGET
jgi:Fic/DOC family